MEVSKRSWSIGGEDKQKENRRFGNFVGLKKTIIYKTFYLKLKIEVSIRSWSIGDKDKNQENRRFENFDGFKKIILRDILFKGKYAYI